MKFDNYINEIERRDAQAIMNVFEDIIFLEEFESLSEAIEDIKDKAANNISDIKDKVGDALGKSGIHVKQGKGLIHYFWNINKNIAKLFYHAFKITKSKNEKTIESSKEEIKNIVKSINISEVIDILLRVDTLTLHLFTGPIHIIDSITGTHIWAKVSGAAKNAVDKAKEAIEALESAKESLTGDLKNQTQKYINALRRVFDLGDYKKLA